MRRPKRYSRGKSRRTFKRGFKSSRKNRPKRTIRRGGIRL